MLLLTTRLGGRCGERNRRSGRWAKLLTAAFCNVAAQRALASILSHPSWEAGGESLTHGCSHPTGTGPSPGKDWGSEVLRGDRLYPLIVFDLGVCFLSSTYNICLTLWRLRKLLSREHGCLRKSGKKAWVFPPRTQDHPAPCPSTCSSECRICLEHSLLLLMMSWSLLPHGPWRGQVQRHKCWAAAPGVWVARRPGAFAGGVAPHCLMPESMEKAGRAKFGSLRAFILFLPPSPVVITLVEKQRLNVPGRGPGSEQGWSCLVLSLLRRWPSARMHRREAGFFQQLICLSPVKIVFPGPQLWENCLLPPEGGKGWGESHRAQSDLDSVTWWLSVFSPQFSNRIHLSQGLRTLESSQISAGEGPQQLFWVNEVRKGHCTSA